ncbi:MAG: hypothetical protein GY754_42110 [bacterium]|nr:hypothetical protein [bacterium]
MNKKDKQLIAAIRASNAKKALNLIENGASIHAVNEKNQTVLALATNYKLPTVVKKLLEEGANANSRDQWELTALMGAAYHNSIKMIELLLNKEANIHAKNTYNKTPILYAAEGGALEAMKFLVEKGANINDTDETGATALMFASVIEEQKTELVTYILSVCSNKLEKDENHKNALDYAVEFNHKKIIKLLKGAGLKGTDAGELKRIEESKEVLLIKRATCPVCGAPKTTPSRSAFVYCDYCASFMDWDYQVALEKSAEMRKQIAESYEESDEPTKEQKEQAALMEKMEKANANGDGDTYGKCLALITKNHMEKFPSSYSPRIVDENYRAAFLEYIHLSYKESMSNKKLKPHMDNLVLWQNNIKWTNGYVDLISFRKFFEAAVSYTRAASELLQEQGILDKHPDHMNTDLAYKLSLSYLLENWLHLMEKNDLETFLTESGLAGEYTSAQPVTLDLRHCGGCGMELHVVRGAKKMLCENCGKIIAIQQHEFPCPSCSKLFSFPEDSGQIQCVSCGSMITRMPGEEEQG